MADADDVQRIALTLPKTTQIGSSFCIGKKGYAWFYHEKVDGQREKVERRDVLVIRVVDVEDKQALLIASPQKFFTIPHYDGYPALMARLPAIDSDELTELLTDAWRTLAPSALVAEYIGAGSE